MKDTTENYHGGDLFSYGAHEITARSKSRDFARIRSFMLQRGNYGATCYEARIGLGMSHQTCSARFTDLKTKEHGFFLIPRLDADGKQMRRKTDTGSYAGVWTVNVEAKNKS